MSTSTKIPEVMATMRVCLSLIRPHTNPKKAAGTAASKPHLEGSPTASAPIAPMKVKRFQKK